MEQHSRRDRSGVDPGRGSERGHEAERAAAPSPGPLHRLRAWWPNALSRSAHLSDGSRLALIVFTAFIAVVTVLLNLPVATADGTHTPFVDALFTAVSAVTVTGLVAVDTGAHWSLFGLVVIMLAMKIGGLGVLTIASLLSLRVTRHMGLAQSIVTAQQTKAESLGETRSVLLTILVTSTSLELITLLALLPGFLGRGESLGDALFLSMFYAISAFNNGGFVPEVAGVGQYASAPGFALPVAVATFIGSLGFPVILVLARHLRRLKAWSLHAKLTLSVTSILFGVTAVLFAAIEWTNPATLGPLSTGDKIMNSVFAAVMPRSGGFALVDTAALHPGTHLVQDFMMFIGGGSGSVAGGIKVTTFALLLLSIVAEARGDRDVTVFHRRIPHETIRQAIAVLVMSVSVVILGTFAITLLTRLPLDQVLFEVLSAFATVGLTTGITATLPDSALLVLVLCMYVGRIGPMSLGAALALRNRRHMVRLPADRPIVG